MMKVIGLMSGTSLDGVDAAVVETDGVEIADFGPGIFVPYSDTERGILRAAQGLWQDAGPDLLSAALAIVQDRHVEAISRLPKADLVGFHGQTLAHDPAGGRSHQLGDGALLAEQSGIRTVWDFRTQDLLNGGQGAPLVPFFHFALAKTARLTKPVAFLNVGGVANVTWVDPTAEKPEQSGALLAFDTGPGNALIDDFVRNRTGNSFDSGGKIAAQGVADQAILATWMTNPYFDRPPPKSLDRNAFAGQLADIAHLTTPDGAATLTAFTARSIAVAQRRFPAPVERFLICGGGRRNVEMMRVIEQVSGIPAPNVEQLGFDGDMLEAQAFAYLAARVVRGLPTTSPATTGASSVTVGGKIWPPSGEN